MSLGEQIAVLDGLAALDPNDGRIGQQRAQVDQYGRVVMPGVIARNNVLDASDGANFSGGSSYAPGLPLLPSSVGLAGLGQVPPQVYAGAAAPFVAPWLPRPGKPFFGSRPGFGNIPGVLPLRKHVIDYSGGANYSGGSDYVPGLPLLPSSSGLADAFIKGGYGRAGLGAPYIAGGYGRAGLGQTGTAVDEDLAAASEAVELGRAMDTNDGRIGQQRAQVDEYGNKVMPGVLARSNVLDASEGANYSGGSAYAPGLPLLPSSVGLAGLEGPLSRKTQMQLRQCAALRRKVMQDLQRLRMATSQKKRAAMAKRVVRGQVKIQRKMQRMGAQAVRSMGIPGFSGYEQRLPLWGR